MRLATIEQAKEIDSLAQSVYKLTDELLMESAGNSAAREIDQVFYPELKAGHIGVICGPGNNGGDGLVLARHLHSMGHRDVIVVLVGDERKRSPLCKKQLTRVETQGLRIIDSLRNPEKVEILKSCKLLVDALFGIGLNQEIRSPFCEMVDMINSSRVPVVSLDTPSGLDCNRGVALGVSVRATMTLTFGLAKPGFFIGEGPLQVGKLRVLPIGFPFELLRGVAISHFGFNERLARRYLPRRQESSNKSDHGHLVVLAGSTGKWGAAVLTSASAYRMGTGYVTLACKEAYKEESLAVLKEVPEVMTASIADTAIWKNKKVSAFAVGPGLGVDQDTANLIIKLKEGGFQRVIVDADALTACVQFGLFPLPPSWVITPHSGELSRILQVSSKEIELDRFRFARMACEKTKCHVLLKGFRSVLAYKKRYMVIMSGNSALAKAGTGDVLTGMIGGLLAQGVPTIQATATAAYLHGRMADEWVRAGNDKRSLMAGDLKDHLPVLMSRLSSGALL